MDMSLQKYSNGHYFDHIEAEIIEREKQTIDLIDSYTEIKESLEILCEKKIVYEKALQLIKTDLINQYRTMEYNSHKILLDNMETGQETRMNFLSGTVNVDDELGMSRKIFRVSRGQSVVAFFDYPTLSLIDNSTVTNEANKSKHKKRIFTIFFFGDSQSYLKDKILKICDLYNCSRYSIPEEVEIKKIIDTCEKDIREQKNFLIEADISIRNNLKEKLGTVRLFLIFRKNKPENCNFTNYIFGKRRLSIST